MSSRNSSVSFTNWWCCERLHLASVNFLKTLSFHFPISWWVIYEHTCLYHAECSAVFDQKWYDLHVLLFLFTQSHPKQLYFYFSGWKSPQREMFGHVEEMKQKNGRSTKKHQNWQVQKLFEQWKNISIGVLYQMESTLKVTEV